MRRWVWLGLAVLVAIGAAGSLVWFTHQQGGPRAAASSRDVRPAAPPLTAPQDTSLVSRLTSGNSAEVASAIAMPSGEQVPASTVQGLRTLAPVTANAGSFTVVSSALATLRVTDRTGTKWLLHLIAVNGTWLVLDSVKQ